MAPGMTKDAGEDAPAKKAKAKGKAKTAKPPVRVYERPRGGEARMVSDLVPEIGRAAFRKFGFVQSSVVSRWREIVGDRLADVTQPAMIRFPAGQKAGGTLHLTISGAHAPMLQHVAPDIIGAVNRFFGYAAVAQVRMTHGQVTPALPPCVRARCAVPGRRYRAGCPPVRRVRVSALPAAERARRG